MERQTRQTGQTGQTGQEEQASGKRQPIPDRQAGPRESRVWPYLAAAGRTVLDALYPRRCPVCERILSESGALVCSACRRALPVIREPICKRCGRPIRDAARELCLDCETAAHEFREGRAIFVYEKRMRDAVTRMKFQNRREYADFFAWAMAEYGREYLARIRPRLILPVPMHVRKKRERGFDQCALLAKKLSALTGISAPEGVVARSRYTQPQKGLGKEERRRNLQGAFTLQRPELIRGSILLLDDIYTTGSTLDELARTLRTAGDVSLCFLTLCIGKGKEAV